MSILDQLNQDMKDAMKARDKESLQTIRMLKSAIENEKLKKQTDLSTDDEITVLAREKKQRNDSLTEFKAANRDDLVEKTEAELDIVDKYLPQQLSENEVTQIVQETIRSVDAKSMQDMGKVMGAVMPKLKGKADGNLVNRIVKNELS